MTIEESTSLLSKEASVELLADMLRQAEEDKTALVEALRAAKNVIADALDNMPYLWWQGDSATPEQTQWRAKLMLASSNARAAIEKAEKGS